MLKLKLLKNLIDVYYGRSDRDLDSPIQVRPERCAATNPIKHDDRAFVDSLEALIKKVDENPGNELEKELFSILDKHKNNLTKNSADHLLHKRISAANGYGLDTQIELFNAILTLGSLSFARLSSTYPYLGNVVKILLAGYYFMSRSNYQQMMMIPDGKNYNPELTKNLVIELCERKNITKVPEVILAPGMGFSYHESPVRPKISIGEEALAHLDTEELSALLAHELGHSNASQIYPYHETITALLVLFIYDRSDDYISLFMKMMLGLFIYAMKNVLISHPEERRADQFAQSAVGKLSLASGLRTIQIECLDKKAYPTHVSVTHEFLGRTLEALGLDDAFSSHPSMKKRVSF